ncbi:MAG: Glutamine-dependent NAD(+) synthetase [Promethearchaeota archaeon]|nr:MAG: Glutamine-dependent NAD(+) synthetase [Candidatus Lokiarchaeota archaeon]
MYEKKLKLLLCQINPIVGDIGYNKEKILNIIRENRETDIIIFPEMALVGYPLMDHILDPIIRKRNKEAINEIMETTSQPTVILGTFTEPEGLKGKIQHFYNSAIIMENKNIVYIENKRLLPNYDVFDERRYFSFDDKYQPIEIKDKQVGILICEDIWDNYYEDKVANKLVENGAEFLIVINASPYHIGKFELRKNLLGEKAQKLSVPIIYVNMVGGLDEIVYDGQSFIVNTAGKIMFKAKAFQEEIAEYFLDFEHSNGQGITSSEINWKEEVVEALKLNLFDYFHKSNIFDGVVLGLSGGIDSAFTAYICAEALGAEKVNCIMLPTRYTSQQSLDNAKELCENLSMNYYIHPIDDLFQSYEISINKNLGDLPFDIADENLQARIRATILMYYSNKFNWLLVSTGNKSEIGVGYCTLYGDTNGGKNVPGDLLKVQIYDICTWINRKKEIIPENIITRPPTAELREDQKDSDSLPPYEILDTILREIIEYGIGAELEHLQKEGIKPETILKVRRLYLNSEFKRRQLVQTIKVSPSAFGIGRRYPVLKRIKF